MFKKSLLALSVLAVSTTVSAAGSYITVPSASDAKAPTIGVLGMTGTGAPTSFTPSSVVMTLSSANAFSSTDKITVSLDGASLGLGTNVVATQSTANVQHPLTVKYSGSNTAFEISGTSNASMANDTQIVLTGMQIVPGSVKAGATSTITMNVLSSLGASIDSATGKLGTFINELSSKVTDKIGAAKIDVSKDSKILVGTASDSIALSISYTPADFNSLSAVLTNSVTLGGDFSWMYDASNAHIASTVSAVSGFDFSSAAVAPNASSAFTVLSSANSISTDTFESVITPNLSNGSIPTTKYSVDVASKVGTTTLYSASYDLGSWTLNGSDVTIPYMPFGSAYASSITMTNSGSVVGDITATFTANGKTYDAVNVGTAAAKSVTNIGSAVAAAANALGLKDAQVQLSVTSPSSDIKVVAIYYSKADGDRVQTYSN
jgi:hypothetical protein